MPTSLLLSSLFAILEWTGCCRLETSFAMFYQPLFHLITSSQILQSPIISTIVTSLPTFPGSKVGWKNRATNHNSVEVMKTSTVEDVHPAAVSVTLPCAVSVHAMMRMEAAQLLRTMYGCCCMCACCCMQTGMYACCCMQTSMYACCCM